MKENAWVGAIMYPAALIAYAWCAEFGVNLAGPLVANFFFGVGSMVSKSMGSRVTFDPRLHMVMV